MTGSGRWLAWQVVLLLAAGTVVAHGLHLSITKAEASENEITGKLTLNKLDFVEALDQWSNDTKIYELTPEAFESLTLRYMKRHLKVEANGSMDLKLEIVDAGQGKETMWLAFKFTSSEKLESIKVENRVLFGAFPDQGNVFEVKSEKGKQSHLFRVDAPTATFELN